MKKILEHMSDTQVVVSRVSFLTIVAILGVVFIDKPFNLFLATLLPGYLFAGALAGLIFLNFRLHPVNLGRMSTLSLWMIGGYFGLIAMFFHEAPSEEGTIGVSGGVTE